MTLDELIAQIQSDNPDTRTAAWQKAGEVGAPAVAPLAKIYAESAAAVERTKADAAKKKEMGDALEIGRAAKRAMQKIVHAAGAPGAPAGQRQAVERELAAVLDRKEPVQLRRDALWMISELCGGQGAIPEKVASLLADPDVREDARCCLQRIPGERATALLKAALETVPDDYKPAVAQSLRVRGVEVSAEKYPVQKLIPTKKSGLEAAAK